MIQPILKDDAFLKDVQSTRGKPGFRIWWLGQSGFLLQWGEKHLLFDPYLSDSLTTKYATTDKPHTRMTERVIAPERLDFIDVVTSSHNHTDHLDDQTLKPLMKANPNMAIVCPLANRAFVAERLGISPDRLTLATGHQNPLSAGGFDLTCVYASHEKVEKDEQGNPKFIGLLAKLGKFTVYHAGDTIRYPGQEGVIKSQPNTIALLPINGNKPERRVAGNLDGFGAALLAKDGGARLAIPMHYDMFEFNTATPDEFVATCKKLIVPWQVLRAGERFDSDVL